MKKLSDYIYLILTSVSLVTLTSCGDPREDLVSEYEQTIFDTKIDLSLSVKEIVDGQPIYSQDSLNYFVNKVNEYWGETIDVDSALIIVDKMISQCDEVIQLWEPMNEYGNRNYYKASSTIREWESKKSDFTVNKMVLETYQGLINKYSSYENNTVLYNTFTATYTIKNPMLNNVKQELTHTYYVTPDNTKIVGTL